MGMEHFVPTWKANSISLSNSPKVHAQKVCSDLSNEVDLIAKAHIANG
jgi:hypothetical protein